MILVDTNILIEIYRRNEAVSNIIRAIGQNEIAVSDVTCAELYFGARNKIELQRIRRDIQSLKVLPIDTGISELAVRLVERYALSHRLALADALIASTGIKHELEIYTINIKDFIFIPDVKLYRI